VSPSATILMALQEAAVEAETLGVLG